MLICLLFILKTSLIKLLDFNKKLNKQPIIEQPSIYFKSIKGIKFKLSFQFYNFKTKKEENLLRFSLVLVVACFQTVYNHIEDGFNLFFCI